MDSVFKGVAHQRVFHFYCVTPIDEYTDAIVEELASKFCYDKSISVIGVNRTPNTISIKFSHRLLVPYGSYKAAGCTLLLMRKRDLDARLSKEKEAVRQSKWQGFK